MGKILLTGAAGFLGQRIRNIIPKDKLFCIDNTPGEDINNYDLTLNEYTDRLPEIDSVIHLAAVSNHRACIKNPLLAWELNLVATMKLYQTCITKGCKHFIFTSSEWVYGDKSNANMPWVESDLQNTEKLGVYALTKLITEKALMQIKSPLCSISIFRLAILYGFRKENLSAVEAIAYKVKKNEPVEVQSGDTARCYLHVDDCSSLLHKALNLKKEGIWNLTGPDLVTLKDIYITATKLTGNNPGFHEVQKSNSTIRNLDSSKFNQTWKFKTRSMLEGLKEVLQID